MFRGFGGGGKLVFTTLSCQRFALFSSFKAWLLNLGSGAVVQGVKNLIFAVIGTGKGKARATRNLRTFECISFHTCN